MALSSVSSSEGADLAMLLTLEIEEYMVRNKALKERSCREMEAVGRDLMKTMTGTMSKVDLY